MSGWPPFSMHPHHVFLCPLLSVVLIFSPGCVTTNVQKAAPDTPPALALNLPGDPSQPLQAQLDTVIVFDGPGSWKRRAYWDEYVISFANLGPTRIKLLDFYLVDANGNRLRPGTDWKDLERQSADWFKRYATVENVVLGAGITAFGATFGISTVVGYIAALGGAAPVLGLAVGAMVVSGGVLYLLGRPIEDSEQKINAEFNRRRLAVPQEIRPNETAQGSLFFRITPSPQRLLLVCEVNGSVTTVTIDLAALSHLHRKPEAGR